MVQFIPEFALRGTAETRVVVVPAGTEFRALSRGLHHRERTQGRRAEKSGGLFRLERMSFGR